MKRHLGLDGAKRVALLAAVLLTAGCLGPTPYQVKAYNGGWEERQVGHDRWLVEFFGNGHTTRDTVVAYWLHRCAELTTARGYDYFVLVSRRPRAGLPEDRNVLPARGGYVPIYVPGGTVTTWSAGAVIEMVRGSAHGESRPHFVARELLAQLGPLVKNAMANNSNVTLPQDLFTLQEESQRGGARAAGGSGVKLDDLDALLPKQ